ncbi:MAG: ABC transporter permease subunit [Planctomycetota bacterium]|jgi:NitT/TauT family transport system permease protein|nr:ABC transporter permease subunit [Planctomycetota bacterium]
MKQLALWKPLASLLLALILEIGLGNSPRNPPVKYPFLLYGLLLSAAFFLIGPLLGRLRPWIRGRLLAKADFHAAVFLVVNLLNLTTNKFALLPPIFFPTPDRILAVLALDFPYLVGECLVSSGKLLFTGFLSGLLAGLVTGIAIGFSRRAGYWLNPLIRIIGPIPPTAWIPLVLVAFPTTFQGGAFLIALSVWFPTTVMTSSGIANVQNAYFEVSSTLGAGRYWQIFHVGIPAAMPFIFIGVFTGTCSSFITLMTAEMLGVKNGIGWYINWQREMLSYANVYAGLILIALSFYLLITLLFKLRDYVLVWQRGVIKW